MTLLAKPVALIIDFTTFKNVFFIFNDMINKIDAYKLKHKLNIIIFVWDCNNLIEKNQNKLWLPIQNQQNIEGWNLKKKKPKSIQLKGKKNRRYI
jgi:hypothetical protein